MKKGRRLILCGLSLGLMALLFAAPEASIEYIHRGMSVCVRTMIPSLFPFMVVSELVVRSGAGEIIALPLARLLSPRSGLPAQGICACLLGLLCGFPVGSRAAAAYYRAGHLTSRQFNVVLAAGNVPSSAFLVCAVGVSLFGSRTVGRTMLILALLSALSAGVLVGLILSKGKAEMNVRHENGRHAGEARVALSQILPEAISSAALGMLGVCATVLLFSAVMGAVTGLADALLPTEAVKAVLFGLLEMSGGVCAASLLSPPVSLVLVAAIIGWGGLSVHCQIFSVCGGCPLDVRLFWLGRIWQALVCGGGMWLWLRVHPLSLPPTPGPMVWRELLSGRAVPTGGFALAWTFGCCMLWGAALLWRWVRKRGEGDGRWQEKTR